MVKRRKNLLILLSDEEKKKLMEEIRVFYLNERDEDLGIIGQQQILDLFIESLAPVVYNRALDDAMKWYKNQQESLESDYYLLYRE